MRGKKSPHSIRAKVKPVHCENGVFKKRRRSKQCTLRYADEGSALLTRAIGRKACSPGRIRLVLIQFICRCVQHHQEKKSGPQRHRPLNTDKTTKCKETPPALCVIHKEWRSKKLLQRRKHNTRRLLQVCCQQGLYTGLLTILLTCMTDSTDVKSAWVYMGALNITSSACGPIRR